MTETDFLSFIDQHQAIIHRICRLYCDSQEDREDLCQEIIFQLWRSMKGFDQRAKPTTWMYQIALNTAITDLRKKKRQADLTPILPQATTSEDDEEQVKYDALRGALKQLSEGDRSLMALYLDNLSYQEMADITGLSVSNIGVKLNRIKQKLQTILNLK
ncbi:MAG: RNA polymerase sigma factor [Chitinophagaceae bacterium]